MRARTLILIAALAIAGFTAATLLVYRGRPTPGTVFMALGWISILATGFFLAKAASFDMRVGAAVTAADAAAGRREDLEREKKLLLKAIKECEFDRDTGKLDSGEAAEAIRRYRARAVEILRILDQSAGKPYETLIEKELARRLAATAPAAPAAHAHACPACATENDDDAAFCKKCGKKLEVL